MSKISDAYDTACQGIHSNVIQPAKDWVIVPTCNITKSLYVDLFEESGLWLGRAVKRSTGCDELAWLVQHIFISIPIALAYFLLPLSVRVVLWITYQTCTES